MRPTETTADVWAWRRDHLVGLGVPWQLACEHADDVDWHDVEQLIEDGCPPDLAFEIAR